MRTKLSTCRRKARFANADEAAASARAAQVVLRPYRCDRCGRFHLTSRTKGKWVAIFPLPACGERVAEPKARSGEGQ